ncbi:hypothetical protein CPT_Muenster_324 [Klebsiella phage Muenster]|nr:hypothetical protein CPT_Muenster_324 [Klebsiella phage Muenster]
MLYALTIKSRSVTGILSNISYEVLSIYTAASINACLISC